MNPAWVFSYCHRWVNDLQKKSSGLVVAVGNMLVLTNEGTPKNRWSIHFVYTLAKCLWSRVDVLLCIVRLIQHAYQERRRAVESNDENQPIKFECWANDDSDCWGVRQIEMATKRTAVLGLKITRDFLVSRDVDMYSCLKKKINFKQLNGLFCFWNWRQDVCTLLTQITLNFNCIRVTHKRANDTWYRPAPRVPIPVHRASFSQKMKLPPFETHPYCRCTLHNNGKESL